MFDEKHGNEKHGHHLPIVKICHQSSKEIHVIDISGDPHLSQGKSTETKRNNPTKQFQVSKACRTMDLWMVYHCRSALLKQSNMRINCGIKNQLNGGINE